MSTRAQLSEAINRLLPGEQNKRIRLAILEAATYSGQRTDQLRQSIDEVNRVRTGLLVDGTLDITTTTTTNLQGFAWVINFEIFQLDGVESVTIYAPDATYPRPEIFVGLGDGTVVYRTGTIDEEGNAQEPTYNPATEVLLRAITRNPDNSADEQDASAGADDNVKKSVTGNQTIQSDLTIAKFARPTYSRNRIEADVNGKLRRVDDDDPFSGNHSDLNLNDGTNPHGTTKSNIGLGNVDNTSDLNKPISTATQIALNQKANTSDLSQVAISGDYEDLINAPIPFFDLDFTWEFDGNKTYTFPSSFELVRINWVSLFGIILPKDNIAYTVNPTAKTLTLGSLYTPSNGDKLIISARLINA